eukprot:3763897-Rhodomonas_salina.1
MIILHGSMIRVGAYIATACALPSAAAACPSAACPPDQSQIIAFLVQTVLQQGAKGIDPGSIRLP